VAGVIIWMWMPFPHVEPPPIFTLPHTEVCSNCGVKSVYGEVFDDLDYELLSYAFAPRWPRGDFIDWEAPSGPTSSHDSKWSELTFDHLTKGLPKLQKDTFDSFLDRNKTIAVHQRRSFSARNGSNVRIAGPGSRNVMPWMYARAGFNTDRNQALIYRGTGCGSFSLWEKKDGKWTNVQFLTTWIE
jgi:hypothetical protein